VGLIIDYIVLSVENSLAGFPAQDFRTGTLLAFDAPAHWRAICIAIP